MEAFTISRTYQRDEVVDVFESLIWTTRYYGNSDCVITCPATPTNIKLLAPGKFFGLDDSAELMILETHNFKDGVLTVNGISLLQWLNNRFIRATAAHADRYWNLTTYTPGEALWRIIEQMVVTTGPVGIPQPERFLIPINLKSMDTSGSVVPIAVPYGPVYDALYNIATTYLIGMQITLEQISKGVKFLAFKSYVGADRSSIQSSNPIVRFSPQMESLAEIEEVESIAAYKTIAYAFTPANPGGLATTPGSAAIDPQPTGFDLRASLVFAEDITTDLVGGSAATLLQLLDQRAAQNLQENPYIRHVDGSIVPTAQIVFGRDYWLGDIVEIAGNSGVVSRGRVTEFIRSKDTSGEKQYPTVTMIA